MVSVAAVGAWLRFGLGGGASTVGTWLLALAIVPNLGLFVAGRIVAARALGRAKALVAALPFEAASYLEALRSPPLVVPWFHAEVLDVEIDLAFAASPPPLAELAVLLPLASDVLQLRAPADSAVTLALSSSDPWPSLRKLLEKVLGPLGGTRTITGMRMRVQRRLARTESD